MCLMINDSLFLTVLFFLYYLLHCNTSMQNLIFWTKLTELNCASLYFSFAFYCYALYIPFFPTKKTALIFIAVMMSAIYGLSMGSAKVTHFGCWSTANWLVMSAHHCHLVTKINPFWQHCCHLVVKVMMPQGQCFE